MRYTKDMLRKGILPPIVIRDFSKVRQAILKAVRENHKPITLEKALEQIKKFKNGHVAEFNRHLSSKQDHM